MFINVTKRYGYAAMLLGVGGLLSIMPVNVYGVSDPMEPPEYLVAAQSARINAPGVLDLQLILIQGDRKVAVINKEMVREGGVILDAIVVAIEKEKVIVKQRDKIVDLQLHSKKKMEE